MPPITPPPDFAFDTGTGSDKISIGGIPADANIAASHTHLVVTARAAFGCYTKLGALVSPAPGMAAKPCTAQAFFEHLGVAVPNVPSGTPTKDGRVVFDTHRKRFFMAFQSREEHPRMLIAVSKSENPADGWWVFARPTETAAVNGHDYMSIGVNAAHFMISNEMYKCSGTYPAWNCVFSQTRHLMYPTASLVQGAPTLQTSWTDPDAHHSVPCTYTTHSTDAFWVQRVGDDMLHVWGKRETDGKAISRSVKIKPSEKARRGVQVGGVEIDYTNIGRRPQNAQYAHGKIVFVSNEGRHWAGAPEPSNCVRLMRIDVSNFFGASGAITVEVDRLFGRNAPSDPVPLIYDYGWPAVAVTDSGDIFVGSVRSNLTTVAELRASVWFSGEPDIRGSRLLKAGASPLTQYHMAGACVDPGANAVYLAQQYGVEPSGWRIHVARMQGR